MGYYTYYSCLKYFMIIFKILNTPIFFLYILITFLRVFLISLLISIYITDLYTLRTNLRTRYIYKLYRPATNVEIIFFGLESYSFNIYKVGLIMFLIYFYSVALYILYGLKVLGTSLF